MEDSPTGAAELGDRSTCRPCDPWPAAVAAAAHFPAAPPLRLPLPRRCVVVTTHPDEDLYAVGGLMSAMVAAGTDLAALVVSDGDGGPRSGRARPHRRRAACTELGLDEHRRMRLDLSTLDPELGHRDVVAAVSELVGRNPVSTLLLAPWHHDAHPEHAVSGRACVEVALGYRIPLLQYAVATWRYADGPRALDPAAVRRFPLPDDLVRSKDRATRGHGDIRAGCASAELVMVSTRPRADIRPVP